MRRGDELYIGPDQLPDDEHQLAELLVAGGEPGACLAIVGAGLVVVAFAAGIVVGWAWGRVP